MWDGAEGRAFYTIPRNNRVNEREQKREDRQRRKLMAKTFEEFPSALVFNSDNSKKGLKKNNN